jgi:hypothetical protein
VIIRAKQLAPLTYEFYRGYIRGVVDTLTDSNIEDTHPGLDELIDHITASIICDTLHDIQTTKKDQPAKPDTT